MDELTENTKGETQPLQRTPEEEQRAHDALIEVYKFLARTGAQAQVEKVDWSGLTFGWRHDPLTRRWICDAPPNRGSIALKQNGILCFWVGCIEKPDCFKRESPDFAQFEDALTWIENELTALQDVAQAEAERRRGKSVETHRLNLEAFSLEQRPHLAPYWINAYDMEPDRITYCVTIDLEFMPYDYEWIELSFGKQWRYNEKFPTPARLAQDLRINISRVSIRQPMGSDDAWYHIVSTTRYYHESVAATQAQQMWDTSTITAAYQEGKVIRARYGYAEVETGYAVILGGCEPSDRPYPLPVDREEHMAERALRETLVYALDVDGFRAHTSIAMEDMQDDILLAHLHKARARSAYIPTEASIASRRWLTDHE